MTPRGSVLILHNSVTQESPADARDILEQMAGVRAALSGRGYDVQSLAVDLRLDETKKHLRKECPDIVFNLVEAIDDCGQLVPIATGLLDHLQIPYTGASTEGLLITGNKILAKQWLRAHGLATADWWGGLSPVPAHPGPGRWIIKPVSEDASIGMDDGCVIEDFADVPQRLAAQEQLRKYRWFAEKFVEGREINVALLAAPGGAMVLPIPEIEFVDYPADKPRIVGYAAKWHEDSFECRNTVRRFVDPVAEAGLCAELGRIARRCWDIFQLRGYARVDFRVDADGTPWVLEVNANPCISPDAGFAAALGEAGIPYAEGIERIVAAARYG
ncbi:MAG: D-alanine--D-alanine ligase [Gammaproteobacteria bacterium]